MHSEKAAKIDEALVIHHSPALEGLDRVLFCALDRRRYSAHLLRMQEVLHDRAAEHGTTVEHEQLRCYRSALSLALIATPPPHAIVPASATPNEPPAVILSVTGRPIPLPDDREPVQIAKIAPAVLAATANAVMEDLLGTRWREGERKATKREVPLKLAAYVASPGSFEDEVEARETEVEMKKTLDNIHDRLPAREAELFALLRQDSTLAEAANTMGIAEGTAKASYARIRKKVSSL